MALDLRIAQLREPILEFGGAGVFLDPKQGLRDAGPFDLRFGAAHNQHVRLGIIGPADMIKNAQRWLTRCTKLLVAPSRLGKAQYPNYPGFQSVFHASLEWNQRWTIDLDGPRFRIQEALALEDPSKIFNAVLEVYSAALGEIVASDVSRPDVVLCCLSPEIVTRCWSIRNALTKEEKKAVEKLRKRRSGEQLGLFTEEIEETEEDLLNRDFWRAMKARAMKFRMPIQIATNDLLVDSEKGQDPATRAWNSTVALYYKAGGIPWRLKLEGPTTCFVGITFHHLRTKKKHLVISGIAQAFSTDGEGFALRGVTLPWEGDERKQVHLTREQALDLGNAILREYRDRTGVLPLRIVLHKSSLFDEEEQEGFEAAFHNVPVTEAVALLPSDFRLVRFGSYPPKRGTLCVVNNDARFLFTTGFMPQWETYPGPHIPTPFEIQSPRAIDIDQTAYEVMALTRMNWNTASISGGWPVTLSFSKRVGGIMAEAGDEPLLSSFRYYM